MTPTTPQVLGRTTAGEPLTLPSPSTHPVTVGGTGGGKTTPLPRVPATQRWFWTPTWQAGEREASAQIAAGGLTVYADMAALFADLDTSPTTPEKD
ncbi:hypothetical protein [Parafrankia discariae]|uniref:hypothetical protein n=1 Tax=Parafrankia discariae TaxID=365528 RepID=UPI000381D520|nr:hypothetical protein [Parafrankia discariae]